MPSRIRMFRFERRLRRRTLLGGGFGRGAEPPSELSRRGLGGLTARIAALALAACVIVGPLLSLVVWSLAERWTYPAAWPQRLGFRYWSRMLTPTSSIRSRRASASRPW